MKLQVACWAPTQEMLRENASDLFLSEDSSVKQGTVTAQGGAVMICYPAGTVEETDTAVVSYRPANLVPCENKCEIQVLARLV